MRNVFLCLAVIVFCCACGVEGAQGEKGADGAQGPTGSTGPVGPAGSFSGSCPPGFPILGISATNEPLCDHSSVTTTAADLRFGAFAVETPNGNFLSILTQSEAGPNRGLYQCVNKSCSAATFDGYTSALRIVYDSGLRVTLDSTGASGLRISRCTTSDCRTETKTVTQIVDYLHSEDLFIGSNGFPVIVYKPGSTPGINVHACSNADCSSGVTTTVLPGVQTFESVMRQDGRLLVFYIDRVNAISTPSVYDCADAQCLTGASRAFAVGGDLLDAAVGPNGVPFFVNSDRVARTTELYLCSDVNCSSASSVSLPVFGVSLAVRPNNLASMLTLDGRLLSCSNPSCATSTLADAANGVLRFASDGRAVISDPYTDRLVTCLKSTCEH